MAIDDDRPFDFVLLRQRAELSLGTGGTELNALGPTLVEFLLRLSTGLAFSILLVPSRWVTSGFFRVHLWVLLGLGTVVAMSIYSLASAYSATSLLAAAIGLAVAASAVSYLGAVVWMYNARALGKGAIALTGICFGLAALMLQSSLPSEADRATRLFDFSSASAVLGLFMAAMLLGHWYLNAPGMRLEPLQRLVALCAVALVARGIGSAFGLVWLARGGELDLNTYIGSFIAFRWLAGLLGPGVMLAMTWQTLKIPNTQSATGILYAAVTLTFLGELASQLLAHSLHFPL